MLKLKNIKFKNVPTSSWDCLLDMIFPINYVYINFSSISTTSPASLYGGTWESITYIGDEIALLNQNNLWENGNALAISDIVSESGSFIYTITPSFTETPVSITVDNLSCAAQTITTAASTMSHYHTNSSTNDNRFRGIGTYSCNKIGVNSGATYSAHMSSTGTSNPGMTRNNSTNTTSISHNHKVGSTGRYGAYKIGATYNGNHMHGFTGIPATIGGIPKYMKCYIWRRIA